MIFVNGNPLVAMPLPYPMPMLPSQILREYGESHDLPVFMLTHSVLELIPLPKPQKGEPDE